MCASVYSPLIFFFVTIILTITIMHGTDMAIEGLPLRRQERGANGQDILAGADFLSVFMESSLRRAFSETTSTTAPTTIVIVEEEDDSTPHLTSSTTYMRPSRSTHPFAQTTEQLSVSDRKVIPSDPSSNSEDGVVVAVRVSSSVGRSINKELFRPSGVDTTTLHQTLSRSTTGVPDQSFLASEEHPSIVAAASKSELSVEESDPITKDSDLSPDLSNSYPASVRELTNQARSSYDPTAGFLDQDSNSDVKQPYQTVIYHDNPSEGARARSVSYSSIIQAIPQAPMETEKPVAHERHERNYNGARSPYSNIYESNSAKSSNNTRSVVPSRPWHRKPTTERNWETQEKPYVPPSPVPTHLPKVFGRPEQNYEVDEAVSVVTNGRAHGVQPSVPSKPDKKEEDNQKVGYVVEGRNYRKYRVEERTPDGFIVGEYGVVSHDDGSLRGVRYTADGTINPKLISEALLKFLSL